jgi:large conductance mechanosensitive channel
MGLLQEFKEFAMKGDVVDLAVGVVIGTAFGKIVTSIVHDIIMPPIGLITGGVDFSAKKVVLRPEVRDAANNLVTPENAFRWGAFITNVIDFLIVALAIFAVVKLINRLRRAPQPAPADPPPPTREEQLLTEIRDTLRSRPA